MVVDILDNVTYIGSPYYSSRDGYKPEAVVWHIMDGTLAGCDQWFNNNPYGVSAHFGIGKDGTIHQYVYLTNAAHANGNIENWQLKLIKDNEYDNPNSWTFSIEFEGMSGDSPTTAQKVAGIKLTAWLFKECIIGNGASGVTIDRNHILRHSDISPVSREFCPGWSIKDFDEMVEGVKVVINSGTVTSPTVTKTYEHGYNDALTDIRKAINEIEFK